MRNPTRVLTVFLFGLVLSTGLTVFGSAKRRAIQKPSKIKQTIKATAVRVNSGATVQQQPTTQGNTPEDDISIIVNLRADSLRFDVVPNSTTVEFFGKPDRVTVWEVERDNLPRPVQPGVTYRDIGIRLRITSRFRDIERIVAEALGEIPVTDSVVSNSTAANPQKPAATSIGSSPKREHPE